MENTRAPAGLDTLAMGPLAPRSSWPIWGIIVRGNMRFLTTARADTAFFRSFQIFKTQKYSETSNAGQSLRLLVSFLLCFLCMLRF